MTARQSLKHPVRHGASVAIRRRSGLAAVVALLLVMSGPARVVEAANPDDHQVASSYFPAWFKQSFLDLQQDLAEAGSAGKQGVMVLFSIRGCPACKQLVEHSLKAPDIEASLRGHFDVIHLDIHSQLELRDPRGHAMTVRAFAAREGATFSPTVAFYGLDGLPLLRVVGYQTPARFRATLGTAIGMPVKARHPSVATGGRKD